MIKYLKSINISKAHTFKKSLGFFVVFIAIFVLYSGIEVSYGMGSINNLFNPGSSSKKTTIIRGIARDKSKPYGQGNIAGARLELLNSNNSLLSSVSSNAQGVYEIKLKLSSGSYKVVCKANNFKQAEIRGSISKGKTYNTGFDFYLEPIDTISPVITLTRNNFVTNEKGVVLKYTLNDNITLPNEIQVTGDQSPYTKEGVYNVTLTAKDKANNTSTAQASFTIDRTAPVLSITPVASPTKEKVVLSYHVSDNLTPVNKIIISGDNSPYIDIGEHKVTLTATDLAGNSVKATVEFTIYKPAPVVIITSPQNGEILEDTTVQLRGTVDGVAFSEPRSLNPGENILTKTVTDSAGNTVTASVTVTVYLGELIGPEGGQVTSADGKVKVIIPAGALSTPTRIKVSKIDPVRELNSSLRNFSNRASKDLAPDGMKILSVVECKPYGLVFNKPVDLIYSLEQAEIPGTAVELGLYDGIQDKIIPTGQTTTVPVDGYTVKFTLQHFSTYACLDYVSKQGAPIGAGVKIPLPDLLTGSFSHAIPITVPPGRKGMQPQIGLSYRSSNPNSWVGLGYSLNSGYIVRSTRLGPPTYDDKQDTFYFITEAGTTELAHLIDNLYQAKVESGFTKFFKETDDTWRVVTKDGAILRFGQTTDSKEASPQGTFSWYITKAVDTNGNYIEYNYTKDQGKAYLSRIDYTGNETGISPTNSVEFNLEPREDIGSNYISTSRIATAKRLKEIEAKVKGELVWRYELEYGYSPDSNRSLLKSVKQSGSDGKSLPEQKFSYQKAK